MGKQEELSKLLESPGNEPEGVTVQSADGRLFFLTNGDAARLARPDSGLYTAFRLMQGRQPKIEKKTVDDYCGKLKTWLDTHDYDTPKWRALCLSYFDDCA